MINFKLIRWKNIFSYGNAFTEIPLDSKNPICIIGESGSGKSTLLDALSFVLYGKPHRSITKNQIPNSINGKDCLVEIEFSSRGKEYLIRRGIRPDVFEIIQDGYLLDQSSSVTEYQKILEEDILQMNKKTFTQSVILSSTNYIPFMMLTAGDRRKYIEDILEIGVLTGMKEELATSVGDIKTRIKDNEYSQDKLSTQKEIYSKQKGSTDTRICEQIDGIIQDKQDKIQESTIKIKEIKDEVLTLKPSIKPIDKEYLDLCKEKRQSLKYKLKDAEESLNWFQNTDTCPTCTQPIDAPLKRVRIDEKAAIIDKVGGSIGKANLIIEKEQKRVQELESHNKKIESSLRELETKYRTIKSGMTTLKEEIASLNKKKEAVLNKPSEDIDAIIESLDRNIKELVSDGHQLQEELGVHRICETMLKDGGIREAVVNNYIPSMNSILNGYLDKLGLFVTFQLDGEFNEIIRSRSRDKFTYSSFSMGERARIDIAILLMLRELSGMKMTVATNLLIMDEVFDNSMDQEGCNNLIDILNTLDTSVIVISHNNKIIENFEDVIVVRKIDNYSIQERK